MHTWEIRQQIKDMFSPWDIDFEIKWDFGQYDWNWWTIKYRQYEDYVDFFGYAQNINSRHFRIYEDWKLEYLENFIEAPFETDFIKQKNIKVNQILEEKWFI